MDKCKERERKKKDKRMNEGRGGRKYERSDFPFKTKYAHNLKVTIKRWNKIYIINEVTFR
jgi:hypothetical protein